MVKCPDCHEEIRSNNIKLHRERHVKQLNAKKSYTHRCQNCNFGTNRKWILIKHALVHDPAHQLAKLVRKKQRKKERKLSAGIHNHGVPLEQIVVKQSTEGDECDTQTGVEQAIQIEQHDDEALPTALIDRSDNEKSTQTEQSDDEQSQATQTKHHDETQTVKSNQNRQFQDVKGKLIVMKQMLNIHYNLIKKARPEEVATYVEIFEAMAEPFKNLFADLTSLHKDSDIDRTAVCQDFSEMVHEMTRK